MSKEMFVLKPMDQRDDVMSMGQKHFKKVLRAKPSIKPFFFDKYHINQISYNKIRPYNLHVIYLPQSDHDPSNRYRR